MKECHFEVEDATRWGVDEAIFLYNIRFWLKRNKANKKHLYKDRYWTYNTYEVYAEFFPFWSESQVKRIVKKLKDFNILLVDNFNENKWDKTNWYSINEQQFCKNPQTKSSDRRENTVRSNNTDNNTDTLVVNSKESTKKSCDNFSESSIKRECIPEVDPMYHKFIKYWNTMPLLRNHREGTKTWRRAAWYFALLQKGNIAKVCTFSEKFIKDFNIDLKVLNRPLSAEQIYKAIENFNKKMNPDFEPKYKDKLPKNIDTFIFNPSTGASVFLTCLGDSEPRSRQEEILDQKAHKLYRDQIFQGKRLNDAEQVELIKASNFVVKRQRNWYNKVGRYLSYSRLKGVGFYKIHIDFLRERYVDAGVMDTSKILNQNIWRKYQVWLKSKHKIDLEPSNKKCQELKKAYEEAQEEAADQRRKERKRVASRGLSTI
jgi:hypothetical protein